MSICPQAKFNAFPDNLFKKINFVNTFFCLFSFQIIYTNTVTYLN